jgi:hypothetical protein
MDHGHGAAGVFLRDRVFVIASQSYLARGAGGSVANGWVMAHSAELDDAALGRMVRAAWAASGCNVPMPDWTKPFPPVQAIGMRQVSRHSGSSEWATFG